MFAFSTAALPKPFDRARAERTFERLAEQGYRPEGDARTLLESAFGNSAYLCRVALREHALLPALFAEGPRAILDQAMADAMAASAGTEAEIMASLLRSKRRAALAVALADIAGAWTLEDVTAALTNFADACVKGALRFALMEADATAIKRFIAEHC